MVISYYHFITEEKNSKDRDETQIAYIQQKLILCEEKIVFKYKKLKHNIFYFEIPFQHLLFLLKNNCNID